MIRRPQSEFQLATFSSIQLWTTIVVLILAPLFFGSVDLLWIAVWTFAGRNHWDRRPQLSQFDDRFSPADYGL